MAETRLLHILETTGEISPHDSNLVLCIQDSQRPLADELREKCGEVVVRFKMATQEAVTTALSTQKNLRLGFRGWVTRHVPTSISSSHLQIVVTVGAGCVVAAIWWMHGLETGAKAASLSAVGVAVVNALLRCRIQPGFLKAIRRALTGVGIFAVPLAAIAVLMTVRETGVVTPQHGGTARDLVLTWYTLIRVAVFLLIGIFFLSVMETLRSRKEARFLKARSGLLKDMMIRAGRARIGPTGNSLEREEIAIGAVLDGLRPAMQLRRRRFFLRKPARDDSASVIAAYLVPDRRNSGRPKGGAPDCGATNGGAGGRIEETGSEENTEPPANLAHNGGFAHFRIAVYSWDRKVTKPLADFFGWIQKHQRPAAWNEQLHRTLLEFAQQKAAQDPNLDWEELYRNQRDRDSVGSVTGWVFEHGQVAMSNDASKPLHFDHSSLAPKLEKSGFSADIRRWANVGSFIACPVPGADGAQGGVLVLTKTHTDGFDREDSEFAVAAAQLIAAVAS